MLFVLNLTLYIVSFIAIWFGSGILVSSTDKLSKKLKISAFAVSFIVLGLLTSIPEFAVGLQAIANKGPEIFIGNLLGGISVIFLFIIPILAIFGNGINLKHELDNKNLLATLGVILAPSLLILNKNVSISEGMVLIILYFVLLLLIEKQHGIFDKENSQLLDIRTYSLKDIVKILIGIGLVFISSSYIVGLTVYFSNFFHLSAFYISLIAVSFGTNLPELSVALRSVYSGKKDIAMGDYMGSASANTLLFGIFTLLNGGEVLTDNNFIITFLFTTTAVALFYIFSRTKNFISRIDGFVLLAVYFLFVILEFAR